MASVTVQAVILPSFYPGCYNTVCALRDSAVLAYNHVNAGGEGDVEFGADAGSGIRCRIIFLVAAAHDRAREERQHQNGL